ncbi:PAAR domain-containing protein [Sinorhizobium sp. BG8]|uniref:PAAR domain-containing protein n=1 Tax=Sinorhizobium sp. BG8 TaxID=2613773 RepID=UPI00193E9C95|nr:PAAR domain-containing protein [Sinorhizobium sp. BG8]QRM56056.1 hypothetical protein F3Y30_17095 [Sinorhizobium sp. BG8]
MSSSTVAIASWIFVTAAAVAFAGDDPVAPMPACALSGAASVMIGGAPALRLSDVANCPPELYEVVPGITIEGQPIVHFRSGAAEKGKCIARGEGSVLVESGSAARVGDVLCTEQ